MGRKKKVEQEVYHVEVITKARVSEEGDWEYYVKWAGYDSDADTWEPSQNVLKCQRLLSSFWDHVGNDDDDYSVGYEITAKDHWIKKEKEFFATQFAEDAKLNSEKDTKKPPIKQTTKAPEPKQVETDTDGSEESYTPLKQRSPVPKTLAGRGKKRNNTLISSDSDSDSSEDRPLKQRRKQTHSKSRSTTADKERSSAAPAPNTSIEQPSRPLPPPPRPSTSSAIPSSNVPRPPKIQPIRTHQDQRSHPLVKSIELPSNAVQSGSTLSTKQRIAAGSGPSVAPKPKPLQTIPKLLTGLSFKKKHPEAKDPSSATSSSFKKPFENEPLSAGGIQPSGPSTKEPSSTTSSFKKKPFENETISASDVEPSGASTAGVEAGPSTTTPVWAGPSSATKQTIEEPSADWNYNTEMFEAADDNPPPPSPAPPIQHQLAKPAPPKRASEKAADEFLQSLSLNMPGLNSPLEPSISDGTQEVDCFPPKAFTSMKTSVMPKIPKKWKWEGDLFVDFAKNQAEKICEVTIKDATDSRDNGARMSFMMAQTDSVRIQKLYNVTDLTPVFRACGEAQQFAKLEASENQDSQALHGLFRHMSVQRQVAVLPLSLDGAELALLFVFSPSLDALCRFLRVPEHLRQDSQNTHVLVTLLPWLVSSAKYSKGTTRKRVDETIQQLLTPGGQSKDSRRRILREAAMAIDLLSIPRELLDFMQFSNRKYCIWSFPADGAALNPGFETRQLKYVLDKTKATSVSLDGEARVIFIHVGALKTFYELSAVVTKRRDAPEVRFFTYGTHESVPSSRWGMREIFPLGGIVTFTPLAIAEDPVGCYNLMRNLAQHPLWECYLIPSIVGLSHSLACGKDKPVPEIMSMDSCLLPILDLGDAGSVSITKAPTKHSDDTWIVNTFEKQLLGVEDVLRECIESSMERFAQCSESDILVEADREISQDLINMELQPTFMDNYRRFVVIRAASDETRSPPEGGLGLEWSSISNFAFKDDYFLGS
ncbi:hypothetical protein F4604DRAFT_1951840 [Suillus subluteus]|nr:hypothetical protein F4604DRAFT_1951840 [Suillus subluteus]